MLSNSSRSAILIRANYAVKSSHVLQFLSMPIMLSSSLMSHSFDSCQFYQFNPYQLCCQIRSCPTASTPAKYAVKFTHVPHIQLLSIMLSSSLFSHRFNPCQLFWQVLSLPTGAAPAIYAVKFSHVSQVQPLPIVLPSSLMSYLFTLCQLCFQVLSCLTGATPANYAAKVTYVPHFHPLPYVL